MSDTTLLTAQDYMAFAQTEPDQTFTYGNDPQQMTELYLPSVGSSHPVIIFIHGGCWRAEYGLRPASALCRDLTATGYAVWNIEYRRIGSGGGWITTFSDVASAVDLIREVAPQHDLDLSTVTVMGHSAGGHLALWVAGRRNLLENSALYVENPLDVHKVISLAGVSNLTRAVEQGLCGDAPAELMGGAPAELPERYAQASPDALLPLRVPHTHIIGEQDDTISIRHVQEFVADSRQAGDTQVELILLPDVGHFEIVAVKDGAWQVVKEAL